MPRGEGEPASDGVEIKAGTEQLAVTDSLYSPGESGPGNHVHHEHADCFYVLGGELVFELAGEPVRMGAGGFVLVPPNVVHTFRNEGSDDARFLNLHAPGMGFDDHLRAMRDGREEDTERFDDHDPPVDGGRPAADALVVAPGEGERLSIGPATTVLKATGDDGQGSLSFAETTLPAGAPGPPPHVHLTFADGFYVLEGELTLLLGGSTRQAGPGTFAMAPPGAVHTFSNPGPSPVRFLNVMAPGGFERYLREAAAAVDPGKPPDPQVLAGIAARYDIQIA